MPNFWVNPDESGWWEDNPPQSGGAPWQGYVAEVFINIRLEMPQG